MATRKAGSASGTGKRAKSNPGTAPRADSAKPKTEPERLEQLASDGRKEQENYNLGPVLEVG